MAGASINPWISIWTAPRSTVRRIIALNPAHSVHVLAGLGGIAWVLESAAYGATGARFSAPAVLLAAVICGPPLGLLRLYLGAALLAWSGRWLGGRGDAKLIRCAMAWAQVPAIWSLLLWLLALGLIGTQIFLKEPAIAPDSGLGTFLLVWGLAMLAIKLAGMLIMLHALGEVQGFSAWVALANIAVVVLILALPLALLGQLAGSLGLFEAAALARR